MQVIIVPIVEHCWNNYIMSVRNLKYCMAYSKCSKLATAITTHVTNTSLWIIQPRRERILVLVRCWINVTKWMNHWMNESDKTKLHSFQVFFLSLHHQVAGLEWFPAKLDFIWRVKESVWWWAFYTVLEVGKCWLLSWLKISVCVFLNLRAPTYKNCTKRYSQKTTDKLKQNTKKCSNNLKVGQGNERNSNNKRNKQRGRREAKNKTLDSRSKYINNHIKCK